MCGSLCSFVDYMHTVPLTLLCFVFSIFSFGSTQDQPVPAVDHHQHLCNPALGKVTPDVEAVLARDLIAQLDQAGIRRAVLLSIAYQFANPNRPAVPNEYAEVRAGND